MHGSKPQFGAMQQHTEGLLADFEALAYLAPVAFLQKVHAQQFAVFLRKLFEQALHLPAPLFGDQRLVQIDSVINRLELLRRAFMPHLAAKQFHHYVVTDGAHERAKPLGMPDSLAPHDLQNAQQGLLPHVFDQLWGSYSSPCLQQQQASKIADKMMFHGGVTARQSSQIVLIERMELPRDLRGADLSFPS